MCCYFCCDSTYLIPDSFLSISGNGSADCCKLGNLSSCPSSVSTLLMPSKSARSTSFHNQFAYNQLISSSIDVLAPSSLDVDVAWTDVH